MLFACLLTGCLLLLLRAETSHLPSCLVGAGILAGGCFLTRSVGFVLLVAPTLYLLFHRQWKRIVWFGLIWSRRAQRLQCPRCAIRATDRAMNVRGPACKQT